MTNKIFMVYIDEQTKRGDYDSCVTIFEKEEDARDYCQFCKETKKKNKSYYYVDMELNKCKDIVNWWKNRI